MYCKNCGMVLDDYSPYCSYCGTKNDSCQAQPRANDRSNIGFAILGFFIPLAGIILFLIYEGKNPKRAKAAGKGALIGFIIQIVLAILLVILKVALTASFFGKLTNLMESEIPTAGEKLNGNSTEEILENCADVTFGEFKISGDEIFPETSLEVTVKNKAEKQYTYIITIEAVDASGARIDTDMIFADRLNSGQEIHLTAFEFVDREKVEQFRNATFLVLDITKYDF